MFVFSVVFHNTQYFAPHCCSCTWECFGFSMSYFFNCLYLLLYLFSWFFLFMPLNSHQLCCCIANIFFLVAFAFAIVAPNYVVVADINEFVIAVGLTLLSLFLLVYRYDFWVHVYLKICSLGTHAPNCRFGNTLGLWQRISSSNSD